ncbi:endonuclease/Exonuclease/phosphatase [Trypanosoma theileri]|uniref:Endonuclease/Exonuclease/phosphatase n=1 Tax=Trypanosoma theileri TaxID=67003 RepID=A0A1X0P8Y5_9TRYP|nr:endonuclease/Exonuclease/phosphatase [Trypanosoma theileri]ORC93093.1 endonuclease/Exonuclease/phosphatase [Trypanosoma theileri]
MSSTDVKMENEDFKLYREEEEEEEEKEEEEELMSDESTSLEASLEIKSDPMIDPSAPIVLTLVSSESEDPLPPESISDLIDRSNDDRYSVPFLIKEETFPVPSAITEEPWTPGQPLRISYISWNMAHKPPVHNEVSSFCIRPNAHIVVVCTQENGSHLSVKREQQQWVNYVTSTCLQDNYILVRQKTLWYIQILVYARKGDVATYVVHSDDSSVKTGIVNGLGGNKGGVAVSLVLSMSPSPLQASLHSGNEALGKSSKNKDKKNGTFTLPIEQLTSVFSPKGDFETGASNSVSFPQESTEAATSPYITLLFIGAHLAAHQKAVNMRNKDYNTIVKTLNVGFRGRYKRFFRKILLGSGTIGNEDSEEEEDEKKREEDVPELSGTLRNAVESKKENSETDNSNNNGDTLLSPDNNLSLMNLPPTSDPSSIAIQQELISRRDVTEEFDFVLFGGDLNYRINGTRKGIEYIIRYHKDIRSILIHNDQLNLERAKGAVFQRFREGNLLFRPTYKYEVDHDVYNFSKKKDRMPAYCDRILYKKRKGSNIGKVKIRLYTDVQQVRSSDHRPVVAIFDVATRAYI